MKRKEYKLLYENWSHYINEDDKNRGGVINKENYKDEKEIINIVWTIIQILDPTPISGLPDAYEAIESFKKEKTIENALVCIWNGVTLIPGVSFMKKLTKLKKLFKSGESIKDSNKSFELIKKVKSDRSKFEKSLDIAKDLDDLIEGIKESDYLKNEYDKFKQKFKKQISLLNKIKEVEFEKEIEEKLSGGNEISSTSDSRQQGGQLFR